MNGKPNVSNKGAQAVKATKSQSAPKSGKVLKAKGDLRTGKSGCK